MLRRRRVSMDEWAERVTAWQCSGELRRSATHEPSINQDGTSWRFDSARAVMWVFTSRRLAVCWIDSEGA